MTRILTDVYSLLDLDRLLARPIDEISASARVAVAPTVQNLVACEEIFLDPQQSKRWLGPSLDIFSEILCPILVEGGCGSRAAELLAKLHLTPPTQEVYDEGKSGFELRTAIYIELARQLDVYYAPHPERLKTLRSAAEDPTAASMAIRLMEAEIEKSEAFKAAGVDLFIPPVADFVFEMARHKKATLAEAILEVRYSKNAERFRSWCSGVDDELRANKGRSRVGLLQSHMREVKELAQIWSKDLDSECRFTERTLTLTKIWGIGAVLEFLGLDTIKVKDPIIESNHAHLLFLNDLYRPIAGSGDGEGFFKKGPGDARKGRRLEVAKLSSDKEREDYSAGYWAQEDEEPSRNQ